MKTETEQTAKPSVYPHNWWVTTEMSDVILVYCCVTAERGAVHDGSKEELERARGVNIFAESVKTIPQVSYRWTDNHRVEVLDLRSHAEYATMARHLLARIITDRPECQFSAASRAFARKLAAAYLERLILALDRLEYVEWFNREYRRLVEGIPNCAAHDSELPF